jgi:hypothetical protein
MADTSRAMGRNAAYWASTPGPPDDVSATAWHRDVAREPELDLAVTGQRDVLAVGALRS